MKKIRSFIHFYALGRIYGIPRCCVLQWCLEKQRGSLRAGRRRDWGACTQGRVPCSFHAALLGEINDMQRAAIERRRRGTAAAPCSPEPSH